MTEAEEESRLGSPRVTGREGPNHSSTLLLLSGLFVASGFTALVQEQVYEKLLGTLLGTSTPAAAIVLATYFLGMTLGAGLYSRFWAHRVRRRLRFYGLMEVGAGLWAVGLFLLFDRIIPMFVPLLQWGFERSSLSLSLVRLLIAVLWILPPTIMVGATLPAVADGIASLGVPNTGRVVASFYSLNIVGAVAGACLGPYLLFPWIGLDRTLLAAGIVGCLVGGLAWPLDGDRTGTEDLGTRSRYLGRLSTQGRLLLLISFFGGLIFFALEVLWVQLISVTFGNSIYSFATMLTMVLIGLFAGGWWASRWSPGEEVVSALVPGTLFLVATLPLMLGHVLWPAVPGLLASFGGEFDRFFQGEVLKWAFAAVLIAPPAAVIGAVFPILFRSETGSEAERKTLVGFLAAANSVGSVAGAMLGTFVLLPMLGSEFSHLLLATLYALLGLGLVLMAGPQERVRRRAMVFAMACLLLVATRGRWDSLDLTSGENVYFRAHQVGPATELLFFHEDAKGGITTVVESPLQSGNARVRTLLTNGKFQGNDSWEAAAQVGFALIPILHTEGRQKALVIGFGTGQSADIVTSFDFADTTIAEIAPGIIEAAPYFPHLNREVLGRPSTRLVMEDGRNLLLLDDERYDLITMEISSIWFAGATNLYSREFYELASSRLQRQGVFQQWLQLHHMETDEVLMALKTVRGVFEHVSFWVFGGQGIVVASHEPQRLNPASLERMLELEGRFSFLGDTSKAKLQRLMRSRLLSPKSLDRLLEEAEGAGRELMMNTDRNRRFEYSTPRYYLSKEPHREINLAALLPFATDEEYQIAPSKNGLSFNLLEALGRSDREVDQDGQ